MECCVWFIVADRVSRRGGFQDPLARPPPELPTRKPLKPPPPPTPPPPPQPLPLLLPPPPKNMPSKNPNSPQPPNRTRTSRNTSRTTNPTMMAHTGGEPPLGPGYGTGLGASTPSS